ncbi:MAG: enoyl-CoA hydratase/isomerase family protein [Candidatus Omnitrophica bacterium]|nr:enoyl-CoA hydratase/isomerase family protein [Candidatus Omnitrophota bacterium]
MGDREFIKTKIEEKVALVTIDRPPVNALNGKAMQELADTFRELAENAGVKVIIITGEGKNHTFVAGADIKEMVALKTAKEGEEVAKKGQSVITQIEKMKKPVIAAINSVCVGGGNELILACHMRIASDRARFGQPEISLGIIPGFGGTQRLARLVGPSKARELILTGDMITAQEAFRIGLVDRVVPDGELLRQAMGFAKKIASKSAVALGYAEEAIAEGLKKSLEEGLDYEAKLFGKIVETADMREGVSAFIEKRQPKFKDK